MNKYKFKAYDKETEQIIPEEFIDNLFDGRTIAIKPDNLFDEKIDLTSVVTITELRGNPFKMDRLILLLNTGYKDINKNDLYEGDIITYAGHVSFIAFKDGALVVVAENKNYHGRTQYIPVSSLAHKCKYVGSKYTEKEFKIREIQYAR